MDFIKAKEGSCTASTVLHLRGLHGEECGITTSAPQGAQLLETSSAQYVFLSHLSTTVRSPGWTSSPACAHGLTAVGTPLALQQCGG